MRTPSLLMFCFACVLTLAGCTKETSDRPLQATPASEAPQNTSAADQQGFGMDGAPRTCPVRDQGNITCTMMMAPGDEFAARCRAAKGTAYFCGCHDYICSRRVDDPAATNPRSSGEGSAPSGASK